MATKVRNKINVHIGNELYVKAKLRKINMSEAARRGIEAEVAGVDSINGERIERLEDRIAIIEAKLNKLKNL